MRLRRISDHVLQGGATHAAKHQHRPAGFTVSSLVDGASGARSSFGVEVRGLAAVVNTQVLAARPPPELSSALRLLLTRHKVVVCRFEAPLTIPQMQWVISLLGEVKDGWARCHDGSMRQYLRYDHPSLPKELRHSGIMEHRSGMMMSPNQLAEKYGGALTATGGSVYRPFVYEGFHTDDSYACTSHFPLSHPFPNAKLIEPYSACNRYTEQPAAITMLHARELPPSGGGDTVFMDMVSAYHQLPQDHQQQDDDSDITVAALRGRCAEHAYNNYNAFASRPSAAGANDALLRPRHPLLRRHPRDPSTVSLYFDLDRATGDVDGCGDVLAGRRLLQKLQDRAEAHAPRYSHRWQEHDVLIWDNVTVQHAASSDFKLGEDRTMWRCLLEGGVPCGYQ